MQNQLQEPGYTQVLKAPMMLSLKPRLQSLITAVSVDWSGKYPLTPTGRIDFYQAREKDLPQDLSMRSIPVIASSSDEYFELKEAVTAYRNSLRPAADEEIIYELKKLSTHCGMANRDSINFTMMLDDYLTDLSDYPLDLIQEACRIYRNSPDKENDFFPRPGKLTPHIIQEWNKRKLNLKRLEHLLEIAENPPKLPPPPMLEEIEEGARLREELSIKLSQFSGKEPEKLSEEESLKLHVAEVEGRIKNLLRKNHIFSYQANDLLAALAAKYEDVFNKGDNHEKAK